MDILTAIRNATGPRPALFVPEVCIEGFQVSSLPIFVRIQISKVCRQERFNYRLIRPISK